MNRRHERIRQDLLVWLHKTRDAEIRRMILAAIDAGPGTGAWSEAVCALGIHSLGAGIEPRRDWQEGVHRRIAAERRPGLLRRIWSRVWRVVVGAVIGLPLGVGIGWAITRWL